MRSLRFPLLGLFFLASGFLPVCAPDLRAQEMFPDIKEIVDREVIRVAIVEHDMPPMIMADKDGKLSGFGISLARVIGRDLGTKVQFERVGSFNDVITHVAAKKADIGVSMLSRTPARARIVRFSRSYVRQNVTLLINRVRGIDYRRNCPTFGELKGLFKIPDLIGVMAGSAYETAAKRAVKDAKLVGFDAFDKMLKAIAAGKLMATIQGGVAAEYFLHANPYANIRLKLCQIANLTDHIGIAVRPDAPNLVEWLNILLEDYDILFDASQLIGKDPESILP